MTADPQAVLRITQEEIQAVDFGDAVPPSAPVSLAPRQKWKTALAGGVLILVLIAALAVFVSRGRAAARTAAIQQVLTEVQDSRNVSNTLEEHRQRLRRIDLSRCPADFRAAVVAHGQAWDALVQAEQAVRQVEEDAASNEALLESFLRGVFGDLFGKTFEILEAQEDAQRQVRQSAAAVDRTWQDVETIAAGYGATLISASPAE